jgi:hypothetical protein
MTGDFTKLYKIQEQTLEDIVRAICEIRGVPYHEIPAVAIPQHLAGLENLIQRVPNSMLSNSLECYSSLDGMVLANNSKICELEKMGEVPKLYSLDTSNKPVFWYPSETNRVMDDKNYYYIGNYIT